MIILYDTKCLLCVSCQNNCILFSIHITGKDIVQLTKNVL